MIDVMTGYECKIRTKGVITKKETKQSNLLFVFTSHGYGMKSSKTTILLRTVYKTLLRSGIPSTSFYDMNEKI